MYKQKHISVVIPAHNEASSINSVVDDIHVLRGDNGEPLVDDIIVCDNASTDLTREIAKSAGASVVYEPNAGYGAACLRGVDALSKTDIVVFVDGDASVETSEMPTLIQVVLDGADLAIGARIRSRRERGALLPQQRVGNSLATFLIAQIWSKPISDLGPFRAITYEALMRLNMQDTRFGWTVEMQVRAFQENLMVKESPVSVRKRIGASKISGTFKGTAYACFDIFHTIFILWRKEFLSRRRKDYRHMTFKKFSGKSR